ncbi:mariner transposase [Trichonephila clavipes]|uniref:Mariner transposase n=1 Tax=Trichonephila clavipes TaxID=2585209 RepID=A0A8X6SEH6_TRICX|nr:mariner transposase [Trichonephila clavipes]
MVIGDEKGVSNDNIVRKLSWSKRGEAVETVVKPELAVGKVLLCIWWDWKGIIYYEWLPYGQTLNSDLYCQQLDRLMLAIDQKLPESAYKRGVFHQDNARPHSSVVTRQKLLRAWLGSFNASTIQSGPGTKRLPPFSRILKLPE